MLTEDPYIVRDATREDAPGVLALVQSIGAGALEPAWCRETDVFISSGGRAVVALANDRVVGFAAGAPDHDPSGFVVTDLYVVRGARRVGIGARLVGVIEQHALHRECSFVDAWCDERLIDAARFFDRRGYTADGRTRAAADDTSAIVRAFRRRSFR